jgi:hypothetical protein
MSAAAHKLTQTIWASLGGSPSSVCALSFSGEGDLRSLYGVSDLASAAIGVAALSIAELVGHVSASLPVVAVDRRLASFWFRGSIRPIDWKMPSPWDSIAGDYRTRDGWIKLHTNAPRHRVAAEQVMGKHADKAAVAQAVLSWTKRELESAIIAADGCAAEMRSCVQWADHPQGKAVAAEPLAHVAAMSPASPFAWEPTPSRPLAGLRVLDMTRVLAGPVATRFLAGYGAEVLRIDPPDWNEPAIAPEVTLGKRCARLDLSDRADRARFEALLARGDILLHGYRPGALEGLGYGSDKRRTLSPGLIDVSLSAYGWSGPWAGRRGFDSLVQMSAGIAEAGMHWQRADGPVPLPVQALDHATGYFMAAVAVRALTRRLAEGLGTQARLSLARTAKLLVDGGAASASTRLAPETAADLSPLVEQTDWGNARRLAPPVAVAGAPMQWTHPARKLGSAVPEWQ